MKVKLQNNKVVEAVVRNGTTYEIISNGQRPLRPGSFTVVEEQVAPVANVGDPVETEVSADGKAVEPVVKGEPVVGEIKSPYDKPLEAKEPWVDGGFTSPSAAVEEQFEPEGNEPVDPELVHLAEETVEEA